MSHQEIDRLKIIQQVAKQQVVHNDSGLTMEGFYESHIYPRITTNYLVVPIERWAEIWDLACKILNKQVCPIDVQRMQFVN